MAITPSAQRDGGDDGREQRIAVEERLRARQPLWGLRAPESWRVDELWNRLLTELG